MLTIKNIFFTITMTNYFEIIIDILFNYEHLSCPNTRYYLQASDISVAEIFAKFLNLLQFQQVYPQHLY